MSRIGNAIIEIPAGVTVAIDGGNVVTVKGPKGELKQKIDPDLSLKVEDGQATVSRPSDQKRHKAMHGLYRSLVNNMVIGVSEGYKIALELVGVGYRATNTGNLLELMVGYSHPIYFMVPGEVKLNTVSEKGKNPTVELESIDKQLVGQVAAEKESNSLVKKFVVKQVKLFRLNSNLY